MLVHCYSSAKDVGGSLPVRLDALLAGNKF